MSKTSILNRSKFRFAVSFVLLAMLLPAAFSGKISADVSQTEAVQAVIRYSENFDGVTAPQIPNGWTVSSSGAGVNFVTATDFKHTAPNAVFAPNTSATGLSEITSPAILVTSTRTILNFRHKYSLENTWDGGVLEIKIGGGQFQDILVAGGTFLAGGYTTTLNSSPNPLGGRLAWSGATQDSFLATSVQLPISTFGQNVQFRWRLGSNDSFGSLGWWIDSVTVENIATGANTNSIGIAPAGTANPYPSDIQLAGLTGLVTGVTVNLENFSHTSPDDVDILLVAPNGRKIVLMSDVGGGTAVNNLSMTFTDAATASLPDNAPLTSGIFKPTNFDETDTFPSPAPQGNPTGGALGAFYGTNPNGTWSLYVVDDNGDNAGTISGGWNLDLQTSINACLFTISPTAQAFSSAGGSGNFQITIPTSCGWAVSTGNSFITIDSPTSGVSNSTVNFTVAANTGAARTGLITITDGVNSRTFQIQQGAGCPSSLAQTSLSFTAQGGSGNVAVTAGAGCTWQAFSDVNWIVITSAQQTGSGTAVFNVLPNPARNARSATITIGARTLTVSQAGISAAKFDFDGDGRSDISVYRSGTWYLQQSTNGTASAQFGLATDKITPADYDGDGKSDLAVYRDGVWYVLQSTNSQFFAVQFGIAGDIPVPADFDGDGRSELAVFRSSGTWYSLNLANNQTGIFRFGLTGDKPVVADYDGDGKADFAVYRSGTWYLQRSTLGFGAIQFGLAADKPVAADYDGDGKADLAVYRSGEWHILTNFQNYSVAQFGLASDIPVAADYDGDGKSDLAVYRDGTWYVLQTSNSQAFAVQFGLASDKPVPAAFIP
ncbi:MAG TPA: FG-GAP-like repeat-containing protein [Pyrinomonadaceae bacterium]|nr:FG-GAP-like repeat-containing protein [Pyrinomonadaceae bacterium]